MYNDFTSYKAEHDHLIAIDSDGCVFDNMTIKHQNFFFPLILETFGIKDDDGEMAKYWDEINLEYPLRGINRFLGLEKFLDKFEKVADSDSYKAWIKECDVLSNTTLMEWYKKTNNDVINKVIIWSESINAKIAKELTTVNPFVGAVEAIINSAKVADVVVVSSANHDAVMREWGEVGLLPYVKMVTSQNNGTKAFCLESFIKIGYKAKNVLMIGDAVGDYMAEKKNSAHYYQITYKNEVSCWKDFDQFVRTTFINDAYQYDGEDVLRIAYEDALKVIKCNVDTYYDKFQHVSAGGVYPLEDNKLWTMSFFPGQLYIAYKNTGDTAYIKHRKSILKSFKERLDTGHMQTHDIGFLFELTAYYDYLVTGDEQSKQMVIDAADKLMLRYHENGGYIQAWGPIVSDDKETRIIIDCMMNLPLLHIASKLTGDLKYKIAATSHALVSSKTLLREDATTYHTYFMDVATGKPVKGATHQGHLDESTWARGQAWSLYGFYKSYEWTKDDRFLCAAMKSADVFIDNLPMNDICYWDFDFTDEHPDIRDSSAASIAAAGLLKLAKVVAKEHSGRYEEMGIKLLKRLANRYQNNEDIIGCGILKEGMYHRDSGFDAYTSWGDYYYVEALSTFLNTGFEY